MREQILKKFLSSIFLNDRRIATITAVLAALAVLIWGAQFGLLDWPARLMIVVSIFLLLVIYLLIRNFLAARTAKLFEKLIVSDADKLRSAASAEQREDMDVLQNRLMEALDTLKTSKLGKVGGKQAALYDLPWYLIIGHPAAGKSTAVLNSGLKFPFSETGNAAVHGVGGTRHCDWFFSPDGVLVDSAGRYSIQNEDRSAWLSFLHLLKKHRPRAPINGVLLVVSTYDLMTLPESKVDLLAKKMRERLQEISDTLSLSLPVYVLFNKVDLVAGFNDFFRHYDEKDIEQVWGATIPHEQYIKSLDAKGMFSERFDELYGSLKEKRREFLSKKFSDTLEKGTFSFPIEFLKLKEPLEKFINVVFSENPYQNEPLFRGFYFTSAVREGSPQAFEAKRLISEYELGNKGNISASSKHASGVFLKELFRDVIFADRNLIGMYSENKNFIARIMLFLGGFAALGAVVGMFSYSFIHNEKLIDTVGGEIAVMQAAPVDSIEASLKELNQLRARIEQLDEYDEDGAPLNMRFGLYKGQDANEVARKEFFKKFKQVFLAPLKGSLEERLNNIEGDLAKQQVSASDEALAAGSKTRTPLEKNYNALKTYLMLGIRERQEYSYLLTELPIYWGEYVKQKYQNSNELIESLSAPLLTYYASQAGKEDISIIAHSDPVIDLSRKALQAAFSARSPIEQVYASLRSEANSRFTALSVNSILSGQFTDVVSGQNVVPGGFTKKAYQEFVLVEIAKAANKDAEGNDWVLGGSFKRTIEGTEKMIQEKLLEFYHKDYIAAWLTFMNGLNIEYTDSLISAEQNIDRITSLTNSPVLTLFKKIYFETSLPSKIDIQNKLGETKNKLLGKVKKTLGNDDVVKDPSLAAKNVNPVTRYFKTLHQAIGKESADESRIKIYLSKLNRIGTQIKTIAGDNDQQITKMVESVLAQGQGSGTSLSDGLKYVDDTLLGGFEPDLRTALRPFFMNPIANVFDLLLPPTAKQVNKDWQENVVPLWSSLSRKKPFANSKVSAKQGQIDSLFGNNGAIQNFYVKNKTLLTEKWGNKGLLVSASARQLMSTKKRYEIRDTVEYDRTAQKRALKKYDAQYRKQVRAYKAALAKLKKPRTFSVMPHPTAGVRSIKFINGGNILHYRNGPQFWKEFTWNGGSIRVAATPVSTGVEESVTVLSGSSRFNRALRAGTVSAQVGGHRIRFSLKGKSSTMSGRIPKKPVYSPPKVRAEARYHTQIYKVFVPRDVVQASKLSVKSNISSQQAEQELQNALQRETQANPDEPTMPMDDTGDDNIREIDTVQLDENPNLSPELDDEVLDENSDEDLNEELDDDIDTEV